MQARFSAPPARMSRDFVLLLAVLSCFNSGRILSGPGQFLAGIRPIQKTSAANGCAPNNIKITFEQD
jgi:hypothetical protein